MSIDPQIVALAAALLVAGWKLAWYVAKKTGNRKWMARLEWEKRIFLKLREMWKGRS